jgi:hypothetical protein
MASRCCCSLLVLHDATQRCDSVRMNGLACFAWTGCTAHAQVAGLTASLQEKHEESSYLRNQCANLARELQLITARTAGNAPHDVAQVRRQPQRQQLHLQLAPVDYPTCLGRPLFSVWHMAYILSYVFVLASSPCHCHLHIQAGARRGDAAAAS